MTNITSFPRNSPTSRGTALRLGQEASLQCWFLDHGHRENVHLDEKRAFLLVALSRRVPDLSRRDGDYTATWLPPVSGNAVFRPELNFARPGGPSPSSTPPPDAPDLPLGVGRAPTRQRAGDAQFGDLVGAVRAPNGVPEHAPSRGRRGSVATARLTARGSSVSTSSHERMSDRARKARSVPLSGSSRISLTSAGHPRRRAPLSDRRGSRRARG